MTKKDDDPLAMHCGNCGFVGRALSTCEVCGTFLAPTLELDDDGSDAAGEKESKEKT